jgi:hypothetical protein
MAGAARRTFAVPDGTAMAGYMAREGASVGTLDALTVGCLTLAAGSDMFVLLAVDLVGVDHALVRQIAERAGIQAASLAVCASHTHGGPAGVVASLHPGRIDRLNAELVECVVSASVETIRESIAHQRGATVELSNSIVSGVAANRLHPDGPFDPVATSLNVQGLDGSTIAAVVHFACHPTILPAANRMISADFPGSLRRNLENDECGVVLFVNGAAGDISTRFTRMSQDANEVERVGSGIADAVRNPFVRHQLEPTIRCEQLVLNVRPRTPEESARLANVAMDVASANEADDRREVTRRQGLMINEMMSTSTRPDSIELHVGIWNLGDLTLIGFPGELFASLGKSVVNPDGHCLVLGYTNGYAGYFPDRAAYEQGSYEALSSPYAWEAVDRVMSEIRSQM